jgi:hypothetical protein
LEEAQISDTHSLKPSWFYWLIESYRQMFSKGSAHAYNLFCASRGE